jgi:hypothetical protein
MILRKLRLTLPLLVLLLVQLACAALSSTPDSTATLPVTTGSNPLEQTADPGLCPANTVMQSDPSGIIESITMAHGVEGDEQVPVDVSDTFSPPDTVHAVVSIKDAPLATQFKATWKVIDIGNPSSCNTVITEYEIVTDGTRNIDFSLIPNTDLPPGSYKVDISVNGTLDQIAFFSVQE